MHPKVIHADSSRRQIERFDGAESERVSDELAIESPLEIRIVQAVECGFMETEPMEPTALAAGSEHTLDQPTTPVASADGSPSKGTRQRAAIRRPRFGNDADTRQGPRASPRLSTH